MAHQERISDAPLGAQPGQFIRERLDLVARARSFTVSEAPEVRREHPLTGSEMAQGVTEVPVVACPAVDEDESGVATAGFLERQPGAVARVGLQRAVVHGGLEVCGALQLPGGERLWEP